MIRRAFTLVEVTITLAITVIIFTALAAGINTVLNTTRLRSGQAKQIEQATRILDYVMKTIREAQPSPTGAAPIVAASNSSLTIYASLAGSTISKVRFFMNGTNLQQGVTPPGSPVTYTGTEVVTTLLANAQVGSQPLFSYFDNSYDGSQAAMSTIDTSKIRLVQMSVTFDPDPTSVPGRMTITLNAQLRNLKDNY